MKHVFSFVFFKQYSIKISEIHSSTPLKICPGFDSKGCRATSERWSNGFEISNKVMKCVLKYASERWSDVYINGCSNATRCYSETYSKVHKLLADTSVYGIISLCIILRLYIDLQSHNPELTVLRLEKTRKSLAAPCRASVVMSISGKSYYSRVCVRSCKTV